MRGVIVVGVIVFAIAVVSVAVWMIVIIRKDFKEKKNVRRSKNR